MVLLQEIIYLKYRMGHMYVINVDKYKSIRTHWIGQYVNVNSIAYFDSFRVEHV